MSKIEWTEKTWNPLAGCDKISAGCKHCYAIMMAFRLMHMGQKKYEGVVEKTAGGDINWTGKINFDYSALSIPFITKKPTVYFVNSMSDLFHKDVPFEFVYKVFEIMHLSHWHTFQVLTKRADRLHELEKVWFHLKSNYPAGAFPSKNVWVGVSVEDQKAANERIPFLVEAPAAVRFLSCEPLLGPVDVSSWLYPSDLVGMEVSNYDETQSSILKQTIDWIIVGGESGHGARPMHPDWARSLRDQCNAAGVPFFFKQWGRFHTHYIELTTGLDSFKMYNSYEHFTQKDWVNKGDVCIDLNGKTCKIGKDFMDAAYPVAIMNPVKKKSERMLDGRTWDEMPNQKAVAHG